MKNIIFLLTITFLGCNSKTENIEKHNAESVLKEPKITGGKYFEYDEIEYYKSEIEEKKLENFMTIKKSL